MPNLPEKRQPSNAETPPEITPVKSSVKKPIAERKPIRESPPTMYNIHSILVLLQESYVCCVSVSFEETDTFLESMTINIILVVLAPICPTK